MVGMNFIVTGGKLDGITNYEVDLDLMVFQQALLGCV